MVEFTTRDELFNFLDRMPHDPEKTDAERTTEALDDGISLYDGGWRLIDEDLLNLLGEAGIDGYFLTAEEAKIILDEISRLTERDREGLYDEDEDDE